jgi:hypothetical protein
MLFNITKIRYWKYHFVVSSCFFNIMSTAEMAPSVMPGMRSIWPMVAGATRVSLIRSSLERPGTCE